MGRSLIQGLLHSGYPATNITVTDIHPDTRQSLQSFDGIHITDNNQTAVADADMIILAVKPQVLSDVLQTLAADIPTTCLVMSIAAGISCAHLQQILGADHPVIRAMPNTPALINMGISGMFASSQVSAEQRQLADQVLRSVGDTVWVEEESLIDAVTAISGSGPAYVFLFMEALQLAATELGLKPSAAEQLVQKTVLGAATMASTSEMDLASLRQQVTSPGGTTEAAIQRFLAEGFINTVQLATKDARQRALELSNQSKRDK